MKNIILSVKPIPVKAVKCEKEEDKGQNHSYTLHYTKEHKQYQSESQQKLKTYIEEMRRDVNEINVKLVKALEEIDRIRINIMGIKEHIQ